MLKLNTNLFIRKGRDRECYLHPNDRSKCIKVTVSGDYRQHKEELKYYRRLQQANISWQHLTRFYGMVSTNLGDGLVFDVVRDYDGNISRTLRDYLCRGDSLLQQSEVCVELSRLGQYILEQRIIMRDIKDNNMLLQKFNKDKFRLIIIDGIGNNEFIPVSDFVPALKTKVIKRKWCKFIRKLSAKHKFQVPAEVDSVNLIGKLTL